MVVTRFAPSPTGSLHIGGIRTALFAYALAKKNEGKFILRIEDTDRNRFVESAEAEVEEMLAAYGISYVEKYRQSDRLDLYRKYAEDLVEKGEAYYCFASKEEIQTLRDQAKSSGGNFIFRSPYRDLELSEARKLVEEGKPYVIRQRMPDNHVVVFDDPVQGTMSFNSNDIDETVLLKSDGFPTYHLAVVVDDHLMEVSHVFRGVEWLPSVPKHVLLYKSFNWEMPVIAHLPVILDPEGGKLSKRKGAVSAQGFLEEGYLPQAVLNFLMLLGWSAPLKYEHGAKEQEFFTMDEFTDMFAMKDINKASPVFNREKLLWFNQKYIQNMSPDELTNAFTSWLKMNAASKPELEELKQKIIKAGADKLQQILLLEQTRMRTFAEVPAAIRFLFKHDGKQNLLATKQTKNFTEVQIQEFLADFIAFLDNFQGELSAMAHEEWEGFVRKFAEEKELKAGGLFMALRLAVTDTPFSPPLFEVMQILGKNETIRRIKTYLV